MAKRMTRRAAMAGLTIGAGVLNLSATAHARGRHPRLEKAITDMKEAKLFLERAPNTFGGHKRKAIDAINEAIIQLEKAIEFD